MKLTKSKLKQLIKEELTLIKEKSAENREWSRKFNHMIVELRRILSNFKNINNKNMLQEASAENTKWSLQFATMVELLRAIRAELQSIQGKPVSANPKPGVTIDLPVKGME